MLRVILILLLIVPFSRASAQYASQLEALEKKVASANNDIDRIVSMEELAQFYALFNEHAKADSVLQRALEIADLANDQTVITRVMINDYVSSVNSSGSKAVFDKMISITEKAILNTQETHDAALEALGYLRLADLYRQKRDYDQALQATGKATTALVNTQIADTISIELFCEMGKIYVDKSDPVQAVRNYNKAFDISYRTKNVKYLSYIYHLFADLYSSFKHEDEAKKNLLESLQLNKENNNTDGIFDDYLDLARLTDQRDYIDTAVKLANQLNSPRKTLKAQLLLYYWYMVVGKNSEQTLNYLNSNPDLTRFFNNINPSNLCWERGNIYRFGGIYNTALDCFHTSEKDMVAMHNPGRTLDVYETLAETSLRNNDTAAATLYFERTYKVADSLSQIVYVDSAAKNLSILYGVKQDYKRAYFYQLKADSVQTVFDINEANNKLTLLAFDREAKKGETDRLEAARERTRQYNLQITAISMVIAGFFFFMLFIGMFEVPKALIRALGYFAFISLFEFILLLLDHPVNSLTKGEPLRLWFVKIGLIAILVPFQHFLEKNLMKFLQSRKLAEWRKKISFKKQVKPKTENIDPQLTEDAIGEIL